MKRESGRRGRQPSVAEAEAVAIGALTRLAAEPERIGRFLALTGLDPAALRQAAGRSELLPAVLDHVTADEGLLLAIASETGDTPDRIAAAALVLSPPGERDP